MGAVLAAGMSAASLAGFERDPAPGTLRASDSPSPAAAAAKPAADTATAAAPAAGPSAAPLSAIPAFFEARARAAELAARLSESALDELTVAEAAETAARLVGESAAAAMTTRKAIAQILPDAASFSAMLAGERDLGDFRASAAAGGRSGKAYAAMAERHAQLLPLRSRYEALVAGAWAAHRARSAAGSAPGAAAPLRTEAAEILHRAPAAPPPAHPVGRKGTIYKPPLRALDKTHPFALDVFFTSFERLGGGVERGPEVLSASAGLVVASSADWKGGAGQDSYVSGGVSPRSGNGVIVYDPVGRRYFSYFHLFDLAVATGDLVDAGAVLGRGGDTGINARRDGHGGHVHVEIFDARSGRPLKALEIRKILFP